MKPFSKPPDQEENKEEQQPTIENYAQNGQLDRPLFGPPAENNQNAFNLFSNPSSTE